MILVEPDNLEQILKDILDSVDDCYVSSLQVEGHYDGTVDIRLSIRAKCDPFKEREARDITPEVRKLGPKNRALKS